MLERVREQVRACHQRASEAARKAQDCTDPSLKADLLAMEQRWLALAHSYEFTNRLEDFTAARSAGRHQTDAPLKPAFDNAARLQEISTALIREDSVESLYERLLDAVIELMSAQMGSMQALDAERGELRLLAWRGFHPESVALWDRVRFASATTCGQALSSGERAVVADVEACDWMAGTDDLDGYRRSGIRAVQSTPLVSRSGRLLGMMSTHWSAPHQPNDGALSMVDVVARQAADLIERSQIEASLRESEARLQAAVDLLGLGLYDWDPQTNRLTWDARVKAIWGLPPDAVVDYALWRAGVQPEDLVRVDAAIAACTHPGGEGIYNAEYRVRGADGVERWVASRGRAVFEDGRAVAFHGVALDITARKRTEEAMRESDERFRQFAQYSTQVLWIVNTESKQLEYLSPAFEKVWGRPRDVPPVRAIDMIHPDDRESALAAMDQASSGEPVACNYRIVRQDGTIRWIHETMFPLRDAQGRVHRLGGIAEDISVDNGRHVYIVDEDATSREGLSLLLQQNGFDIKAFASDAEFIEVAPVLAMGCVIVDFASPQSKGLAIARQLKATGSRLPVIAIGRSGGDVTLAVQAMKAGAVEWLEVPYPQEALLAAVAAALANIHAVSDDQRSAESARRLIAEMTTRERQVLDGLLAGGTNKSIAQKLGISPRTIELHRAGVMGRLGARTLPQAVLMAVMAGIRLPTSSRPTKRSR